MYENLQDIKPLIHQSDYSLFLLIATLLLGIALGLFLFKRVYRYMLDKCKIDCEKYFYHKFSSIDWSNPKEAAYQATRYGLALAKDRRRRELYLQLREHLDKYKYTKDVQEVDDETLNYYNLYKQVCDESL